MRTTKKPSPETEPMVFIVDDDAGIRQGLRNLLRSAGFKVEAFSSAAELLASHIPDGPSCLVLDVNLPGLSGLDFQAELTKARVNIPVIFITGHGSIPVTVQAMKAGAMEFLLKPFRDQDLLDAVWAGIDRDLARRRKEKAQSQLTANFQSLTAREQQVIALVTSGLMNKQIAFRIGVAEITVKVHRGNVMRKMGAKSVADLVRMSDALGISLHPPIHSTTELFPTGAAAS